MRYFIVLFFLALAQIASAVTVDGFCYLEGQSNHAGTKVKFIKVSPSAVTDSTYTQANGYFTINLVPGIYDVEYSHASYWLSRIFEQTFISNTSLPTMILFPGPQVTPIWGELGGIIGPGNYLVLGDVTVSANLIIQPGTTVFFAGHFRFSVYGLLQAIGTEVDSITFTRAYPTEQSKWWGLRFHDSSSDSCRLEYCLLEYANKVSEYQEPYSDLSGGGIYVESSSPRLSHCTIRYNSAERDGGGVCCVSGGIELDHCTILQNTSGSAGGGLFLGWSTLPLRPKVVFCSISRNSGNFGGGIRIHDCAPQINSTIISFTQGSGIFLNAAGNSTIQYDDLFGNSGGDFEFALNNPAHATSWIGSLMATNSNGDSSDIYYNIFENPAFVDTSIGDYFLTSESACIDAGDPNLETDPNGTVADIGAHWFSQDFVARPQHLQFGLVPLNDSLTLSSTLTNYSDSPIHLYEAATSDTAFKLVVLADSVISPGDSTIVSISFKPRQNGMYFSQVSIVSSSAFNDTVTIALSGEGGIVPAPVGDVVLQIENTDAQVCWSPVDTTMHGSPITVDAYLIYFAETENGPFWFHGLTTDTCYIHEHAAQFASAMFYEVTAYIGPVSTVNEITHEYEHRITRDELQSELASGLWRFPPAARSILRHRLASRK